MNVTPHNGFLRVAVCTPHIEPAALDKNCEACIEMSRHAVQDKGAQLVVLPELALAGLTCGDLFLQTALLDKVSSALVRFIKSTSSFKALFILGAPLCIQSRLYNCAVVISEGKILGIVPAETPQQTMDAYLRRAFETASFERQTTPVDLDFLACGLGTNIPFGARQLFCAQNMPDLKIALCVGADIKTSTEALFAAQSGAVLFCNLYGSYAYAKSAPVRRQNLCATSSGLKAALLSVDAGSFESTQDGVFSAHNLIFEDGQKLAEAKPFENGFALADIDIELLAAKRRISHFYRQGVDAGATSYPYHRASYDEQSFELPLLEPAYPEHTQQSACASLCREVSSHPFIPSDPAEFSQYAEEILSIQAHALAKRLLHIKNTRALIGISGGLDSALALLVTIRAFDLLKYKRSDIYALSMPGFGTSRRTHSNAELLARSFGVSFKEIPIESAVKAHFEDIGHDGALHDATYENAQARERTQILMDLANQEHALLVGTGDLSELALGWATYNGDHMSMYAVNAGVPKTLVKALVAYCAEQTDKQEIKDVLSDIVKTPVSPELLPTDATGAISQKTEDVVGPYELHDFFIYYLLSFGCSPRKIFTYARTAFKGRYGAAEIKHWMQIFYQRFFSQQFKRSCMPDGPAVCSVSLSPRGALLMPSDAVADLWLQEVSTL